jgi:hypothetical protein
MTMRGTGMGKVDLKLESSSNLSVSTTSITSRGASQREHRDRSHAGGLPGIVREAGVAPGLFVVDALALRAGEFVDGHRIGVGAALDGVLAGCDEVVFRKLDVKSRTQLARRIS